jgi:hypothetical protein
MTPNNLLQHSYNPAQHLHEKPLTSPQTLSALQKQPHDLPTAGVALCSPVSKQKVEPRPPSRRIKASLDPQTHSFQHTHRNPPADQ